MIAGTRVLFWGDGLSVSPILVEMISQEHAAQTFAWTEGRLDQISVVKVNMTSHFPIFGDMMFLNFGTNVALDPIIKPAKFFVAKVTVTY